MSWKRLNVRSDTRLEDYARRDAEVTLALWHENERAVLREQHAAYRRAFVLAVCVAALVGIILVLWRLS